MSSTWQLLVAVLLGLILVSFLVPRERLPVQEFELVTGEWEWQSDDGTQKIEVYRWDPALLIVRPGTRVTLKIFGVKGAHHTLHIEAFGVHAEILRGQTTMVSFSANKAGIFPILCLDHPDREHKGPMVGYLVVR